MFAVSTDQLQTYLEVATEAALAAGEVLRSYLGKLDAIETKGRSDNLVTQADREAESEILNVLRRHVPEHAILAEESGQLGDAQSTFQWAIDPLDGTTNYTHQYPCFAASIGLLIDGEPIVGVVYDPIRDELFRAAQGLGATRNRRLMQVSDVQSLEQSLLTTGFAYDRREVDDNNYAEFCHLTQVTQGVRRGGAASLDLAYVACGRLDGYWERGLSPWDIAAGIVLVNEAQGQVTAYDATALDIRSGRLLATNCKIHHELSQVLMQVQTFRGERIGHISINSSS